MALTLWPLLLKDLNLEISISVSELCPWVSKS
jgi:hypothetical protein